jgi:hypothetical protein
MSKHSRVVAEYPIVGGNTRANVLRLTLEYRLGGHNYFTGDNNPRGLFLSCSPLEVTQKDGYTTTGYVGFSGTNMHLKDMKRFSQKTLDSFEPTDEQVKRLVDHVIRDNNLIVEGYATD